MKKTIVFFNESRDARMGCMYKGGFYTYGAKHECDSEYYVSEMDVKGLKVYEMLENGYISKEGKVMELEKLNGTLAAVRDEYDKRYTVVLCETYYSAYGGRRILNALITDKDKVRAKTIAGEGITKKKWVIAFEG